MIIHEKHISAPYKSPLYRNNEYHISVGNQGIDLDSIYNDNKVENAEFLRWLGYESFWLIIGIILSSISAIARHYKELKEFYNDLFGLDLVLDNDGNMILTEGLVLQDEKIWKKFLGKDIIPKSNSCELYFEERDIEAFVEKLERSYPSIQYANKLMTHSWGQKVVRFYDLDGNLIEVGTPM